MTAQNVSSSSTSLSPRPSSSPDDGIEGELARIALFRLGALIVVVTSSIDRHGAAIIHFSFFNSPWGGQR